MKKMILSILVFVSATTSFAGNEGPQAAPDLPRTVLVERTGHGGFFVPPGSVDTRQIQILSNGDVVKLEWTRGKKVPKVNPILTLTKAQTAKVIKLVSSVNPGAMVDPNPQSPGCQDGPSYSDAVYQGGTRIEIAQQVACKKWEHENATSADAQLIEILDAVEVLAQ